MPDRRWRLAMAVLAVLGGTALILDWTARDPSQLRPDREVSAELPTPRIAIREAPEFPSRGAVRVESTRDGLTIRANEARRSSILEALGRSGGFSVEGSTEDDPRLRLILKVNDLQTAVVAILGDAEHTLHYAGPIESGAATLTRVVLGREAEAPAAGVAAPRRSGAGAGRPVGLLDAGAIAPTPVAGETEPAPYRTPSEIDRVRRRRAQLLDEQRLEDLEILRLGDESSRAGSVARLDSADQESLDALARVVGTDPSSRVRMRAARRLGFGDAARVTPALTAALSDPDPDVVVEVIEALAFVGEPDAIASLEALSEHESPAVRAAVQDAIEVLR